MSQHKRSKRRSLMTAILAVILILAGAAAIAGSLWMQENEISTGAEVYEALIEQLKLPPTTEKNPETQQDELPADDTIGEETTVTQDEPEQEQPDQPIDQTYEPAVTVVPPLTVQPTEPEQQILQPVNLPESPKEAAPGLTGADLAACKAANSDFAAWLQIPGTDIDYPVVLTNDVDYYMVCDATRKQFNILRTLMNDARVDTIICATDAGREGELIFRLVYQQCKCTKPIKRLWISSLEESAIGWLSIRQYENITDIG